MCCFPLFPNPVKATFPEVGKGLSTALYKSLRVYFSFLEENVHGRIQASSFKWSSGAWHQIALLVQFYWRHMKARTSMHEWDFWTGKFLRPNPGFVSVASLKQNLSSVQEWRTGHEVLQKGRSEKVVKTDHILDCLCWVAAGAEVPVSFLLEKMCKIWRVLVLP